MSTASTSEHLPASAQARAQIDVLGPSIRVAAGAGSVHLTPKDLAVLAALASYEADAYVNVEAIAVEVWGTSASRRCLGSAIYRIRKALGVDAVQSSRGAVRLNRFACDVDAFEFDDESNWQSPEGIGYLASIVSRRSFSTPGHDLELSRQRWTQRQQKAIALRSYSATKHVQDALDVLRVVVGDFGSVQPFGVAPSAPTITLRVGGGGPDDAEISFAVPLRTLHRLRPRVLSGFAAMMEHFLRDEGHGIQAGSATNGFRVR